MKRVLRPKVEKLLIGTALTMMILISFVDDFKPEATPYMIAYLFVIVLILFILERWGRTWKKL